MTEVLKIKQNNQWVGIPAIKGDKGNDGVGIPEGGTTGQVLAKASNTDYDTEWVTKTIPTKTSDLTNDSDFITSSYHDSSKYDVSNPNGYTSNTGTITGITMNGTSKGTSGVVDLGTVITNVDDKSDINATNFSNTGKATLSGFGMPSTRYVNLSVGASGTTYTAPANGYLNLCAYTSTNCYFALVYSNMHIVEFQASNYGNASGIYPIKSGTTYTLHYDGVERWNEARFVYAEGN